MLGLNDDEKWIPGYEGRYSVNTDGIVFHFIERLKEINHSIQIRTVIR